MKQHGVAFVSGTILMGVIGMTTARLAEADQGAAPVPREASATASTGPSHSVRPEVPQPVASQSASEVHMKRVTGIGGVFFKAKDAPALREWYKQHLGIDVQTWGGAAFH